VSEDDAIKPRLIPVKVPWMVTPSTPFLQLHVSEDPHDKPSEVQFVGHLGPLAQKGKAYQLIRVILEPGVWLLMRPGHADTEPIDLSQYDLCELPQRVSDPQEYVRRFRDQWRQTGLCPDPHMYELERSPWLEEARTRAERLPPWLEKVGTGTHEFKHVLISGHDYYVEVLTTGWRYESAGFLTGEPWV